MNVLLVINNFLPALGGESIRTYGLCSHLLKQGCRVTILTFQHEKNWKKTENIDGLNVIRVRTIGQGLLGFFLQTMTIFFKMAQLLAREKYDIVHVRGIPHVYSASLLNLFFRVPVVFEIYSTIFETRAAPDGDIPRSNWLKRQAWRTINNFFLRRVSRIMLICQSLEDYAVERGCPRNKFTLLPNGVDILKFSPREKDDDVLKKYLLQDSRVVLYLGKFQRWEGLPTLVEAFSQVKKDIPNAKLLLVGDGPDRERIEQAIREHLEPDDVIMTGFVPFNDTPQYYSVADVFVLVRPAILKTRYVSPLKPLEAMAMGKVVVSTDLPAIRELVEDGETGFLTGHSVDAISRSIINVLNDNSLREKTGARARLYTERQRDWNIIAESLLKVYRDITRKNLNEDSQM